MKSLDAAYKVLQEAGEALHVEEITQRVLAQGLWTTNGKTPEYTINANILNDIKKHKQASRFRHLGHRTFMVRRNGDTVHSRERERTFTSVASPVQAERGRAPTTVEVPASAAVPQSKERERAPTTVEMPASAAVPQSKERERAPTTVEVPASAAIPQSKEKESEVPRIEVSGIKPRVLQILTDLERVREALLALSDDIWLSIDHNDPQMLDEGVTFKHTYNERMGTFNLHASALSALIQQFTNVPVETPITAVGRNGAAENERIICELDRETAHFLDEGFSYKRPYGFVLAGQAYKDIVTWVRVYTLVCTLLADRDPLRFAALPTNPAFTSRRGIREFSRNQADLRAPLELTDGIYVETNHSANAIAKRIGLLLDTFGIDRHDFVIYLREDRDAG